MESGIASTEEVINTTSAPYEFTWTHERTTPGGKVECETKYGLISSGKVMQIIFSYQPTSTKTVESLWLFQIPAFNLKAEVLIVGKVVPM